MKVYAVPLEEWLLNYAFQGTNKQFTERHQINAEVFRHTGAALCRGGSQSRRRECSLVAQMRQLANDVSLRTWDGTSEVEGVSILNRVWEQWKTCLR